MEAYERNAQVALQEIQERYPNADQAFVRQCLQRNKSFTWICSILQLQSEMLREQEQQKQLRDEESGRQNKVMTLVQQVIDIFPQADPHCVQLMLQAASLDRVLSALGEGTITETAPCMTKTKSQPISPHIIQPPLPVGTTSGSPGPLHRQLSRRDQAMPRKHDLSNLRYQPWKRKAKDAMWPRDCDEYPLDLILNILPTADPQRILDLLQHGHGAHRTIVLLGRQE
jgi:hypothetical protein